MEWKTSWSYLPIHYNTCIGTLENVTQRTYFWNNLSGQKVRVRFSNRYGTTPLILDHVVLAKQRDVITDMTQVTYHGEGQIIIPAGKEFYSDEINLPVTAEEDFVLSIYFKEPVEIRSACSTWNAQSWHTQYGLGNDYTMKQTFEGKESREIYPYVDADANKANIIAGICSIQVLTPYDVKTIALFGDSITHMSYYSDALMEQLYRAFPERITVINRGIGGNRILHDATYVPEFDGEGKCFGTAAISRFEEDVYSFETPDFVFILEGVNDLMHADQFHHPEETVTAKQLIAGLTLLTLTAYQRGSKVFLGTVMPFQHENTIPLPDAENERLILNEWIRSQSMTDARLDFAKLMEDPHHVGYLKDELHIGDGLHPNTLGGHVMAQYVESILLKYLH